MEGKGRKLRLIGKMRLNKGCCVPTAIETMPRIIILDYLIIFSLEAEKKLVSDAAKNGLKREAKSRKIKIGKNRLNLAHKTNEIQLS